MAGHGLKDYPAAFVSSSLSFEILEGAAEIP